MLILILLITCEFQAQKQTNKFLTQCTKAMAMINVAIKKGAKDQSETPSMMKRLQGWDGTVNATQEYLEDVAGMSEEELRSNRQLAQIAKPLKLLQKQSTRIIHT